MKVVVEGNLSPSGSYGIVNFNIALALARRGHEVSLLGVDIGESHIKDMVSTLPDEKLLNIGIGEPLGDIDIRIRQMWPPVWTKRNPDERLIVIQPWEFGSIPLKWLQGVGNVDAVWVPSEYCKRGYLQAGVPHDKVWVVPNGFDPNEIAFNPKKSSDSSKQLLYIGGTIFRKGVDVLIQSLDLLDDATLGMMSLVIKEVGRDTFYRNQSILKDALDSHPRVANRTTINDRYLSRSELVDLMAQCDALVQPYRSEGFGMPILEAMALGRPVFHTEHGASNEFCGSSDSWLISSELRVSNSPVVGSYTVADRSYWREPLPGSLQAHLSDFLTGLDSAAKLESARLNSEKYGWPEIGKIAETSILGLLSDAQPGDSLTSLLVDLERISKIKEGNVPQLISRLVKIGDHKTAFGLARQIEESSDFTSTFEISSVRRSLKEIVDRQDDVWSGGPYRPLVTEFKQGVVSRFLYSHDFEGDKKVTSDIAKHLSGYLGGCNSVLDIGCGQGSMLRVLRGQGKSVQGIEADGRLVRELREDGFSIHEAFVPGGLDELETFRFDGVFLGHIVEHLTPDDVEKVLRWIYSKLEDNGTVLIQTPDFSNTRVGSEYFWLDSSHLRPYPIDLLKAMLLKTGFQPIEGGCRRIPEIAQYDAIAVGRKVAVQDRQSPKQLPIKIPQLQVAHVGLFEGGSGFSHASMYMFDTSGSGSEEVSLMRISLDESHERKNESSSIPMIPFQYSERLVSDVAIIDVPVGWITEISPIVHAKYRIARTTFEASPLPLDFLNPLRSFDEIWCFSKFDRQIFIDSGIDPSRVTAIPPGISMADPKLVSSYRNSLRKDHVTFLSVFNFEPRKNPVALLRAFSKVLLDEPNVELVLKVGGIEIGQFVSWLQRTLSVDELAIAKDHIRVIPGLISRESLDRLYLESDVFVLPSRGEGYGLPFLEALSFALPVICPDKGGHMEFCSDANSLVVKTKAVPAALEENAGVFVESLWREVAIEDLAVKMLEAARNREYLNELGENGMETAARYSVSGYQAAVAKRLQVLKNNLQFR